MCHQRVATVDVTANSSPLAWAMSESASAPSPARGRLSLRSASQLARAADCQASGQAVATAVTTHDVEGGARQQSFRDVAGTVLQQEARRRTIMLGAEVVLEEAARETKKAARKKMRQGVLQLWRCCGSAGSFCCITLVVIPALFLLLSLCFASVLYRIECDSFRDVFHNASDDADGVSSADMCSIYEWFKYSERRAPASSKVALDHLPARPRWSSRMPPTPLPARAQSSATSWGLRRQSRTSLRSRGM